MSQKKSGLDHVEMVKKRIERDSQVIRNRFAIAEKKHRLLSQNRVLLEKRPTRARDIPDPIFHEIEMMRDRLLLELDIPAPTHFHFAYPELEMIPEVAMECVLENNLQLCGAMGTPKILLAPYGEAGAPEDLYQKFSIDNVTTDSDNKSYSFTIQSDFPLTPDDFKSTCASFVYEFIFPVGSSGTYCFLPLTEFLGNISYSSPDPWTAGFTIHVIYRIIQNGENLGTGWGYHQTSLVNNNQFLLDLTTGDFAYDRLIVDLDADHLFAKITVAFELVFYNGFNNDGQFILDCASQGGKIACEYIKWGKRRPVRVDQNLPGN